MRTRLLLFFLFLSFAGYAQISLTLLNSYQLTAGTNTQDTLGVFCRLFYHPARNKFYSVYAARPWNSIQPQGQMTNFAWREYDANMNYTGSSGSLPGFTSAGDFAIVQVDSTYFHLTGIGPNYKLTKFDDDFVSQGNTNISLGTNDSKMDQLMSYGNNRLIIGALYEPSTTNPSFPMQSAWSPQVHLFQYNTNLASVASPAYLNPTYFSWGASAIFNNNKYYVISMDSFPEFKLYAYEYDINWNYLNRYWLSNDGQWSQGVLWDGTYYYVAYHSGGEHRSGNIKIGIYDVNWAPVYSTLVTGFPNYPPPLGLNTSAQRPFLTKVGNKLYVSYDVETYIYDSLPPFYYLNFDWQAHVTVYQINTTSGTDQLNSGFHISVFPNPASENATVQINSNVSLQNAKLVLYNLLGQEIFQSVICNPQTVINVSSLPKGMYFWKAFNCGETIGEGKIIIE